MTIVKGHPRVSKKGKIHNVKQHDRNYWQKSSALSWSTMRTPLPEGIFSGEEIGLKNRVLLVRPEVDIKGRLIWNVAVYTPFQRELIHRKTFKTRKLAVEYSQDYMKKYPKGKIK